MGFFSWECAKSKLPIPAYPYAKLPIDLSTVVLVLPDDITIKGVYDGYGHINNSGIYGLVFPYVIEKERPKHLTNKLAPNGVSLFRHLKYKGKVYEFWNWQEPISELGDTPNNIRDWEGAEILPTKFELCAKYIKLVIGKYYEGERFVDLEVSDNDADQGYFFGPAMRAHLLSKSSEGEEGVRNTMDILERKFVGEKL